MSTTTVDAEVRRYLDAIRECLADVAEDDREELLEDLEAHLLEVAAEDEGTLETRLGPPATYAEELRASAGLPKSTEAKTPTVAQRLAQSWIVRSASAILESSEWSGLRKLVRDVEPGWWVLRGYLAVLLPAILTSAGNARQNVPYPHVGSSAVGVALVPVAVWLSWQLGRRGQRDRLAGLVSPAFTAAIVVATIATLTGWHSFAYADAYAGVDEQSSPVVLHHTDGSEIANICPYSADGKLLSGVLLFDQRGHAIVNTADTVDGRAIESAQPAIPNAYPKSISVIDLQTSIVSAEDGTTRVESHATPLRCPAAVNAAPSAASSPVP